MEQCTVNHLLPYFDEDIATATYNQYFLQNKFCTPNNLTADMLEVLNINA